MCLNGATTTTGEPSTAVPVSVMVSSYLTMSRPEERGESHHLLERGRRERNRPPLTAGSSQETEIIKGLVLSPWKSRGILGAVRQRSKGDGSNQLTDSTVSVVTHGQ